MTTVALVIVVVFVVAAVTTVMRSRRRSLVPQRGAGIGADLGTMGDAAQVRIRELVRLDADRVRVVFAPVSGEGPELGFTVTLGSGEFGAQVLEEWSAAGSTLAIVIPPESRLVRLRSVESLQHLTLRRVDE